VWQRKTQTETCVCVCVTAQNTNWNMCVCVCVWQRKTQTETCVCVCVCVCERERQRKTQTETCVCVCVWETAQNTNWIIREFQVPVLVLLNLSDICIGFTCTTLCFVPLDSHVPCHYAVWTVTVQGMSILPLASDAHKSAAHCRFPSVTVCALHWYIVVFGDLPGYVVSVAPIVGTIIYGLSAVECVTSTLPLKCWWMNHRGVWTGSYRQER
jgi:hypothetical protein